MKWLIPSKDWLLAPDLEQDAPYQDAVRWAREFTPEAHKDAYGIAYEHAKRKYDQSVAHFEALDKKADELMRTAVTIAALLVAAIKALDMVVTGWAITAFAMFLLTIILAAITRRPTLQTTPGSVREVRDRRNTAGDQMEEQPDIAGDSTVRSGSLNVTPGFPVNAAIRVRTGVRSALSVGARTPLAFRPVAACRFPPRSVATRFGASVLRSVPNCSSG